MKQFFLHNIMEFAVLGLAVILAVSVSFFSFTNGYMISYGDSESHLNIAKRVVDSPTPGFSQLGGIWLPLPHLLMVPFVVFDFFWRTGIAGAIVAGVSFIISSFFIYKTIFLVTKNKIASFFGFLIFALNPNILYMQSTPMSELPLIMFMIVSIYFFAKFLQNTNHFTQLILAAFFAFLASLTRYDGWFLIGTEGLVLGVLYVIKLNERWKFFSYIILYSTLAFLGIGLWLLWDFLILGDPLYFSNSPFSAKSQQQGWLARGELPTYHNLQLSVLYYGLTSLKNNGLFIGIASAISFVIYFLTKKGRKNIFVPFLLFTPFIFYTLTLYIGQSVIFIPELTPNSFEWNLFNVRYGLMMVPFCAFLLGFAFYKANAIFKFILIFTVILQAGLFITGTEKVLTWEDGVNGLSASKSNDAQKWLAENYDSGTVLLDDYARTLSIIRTSIDMEDVIYIGNKPYWEESLENPEKYANWVVMQKNDAVWKNFIDNPRKTDHLYKYYQRTYTSPTILVFKRNNELLGREN